MNSSPQAGVYALTDPTEVDIAAIERELETIWRDAAKGENTESVTRASAFNLIYVTAADDNAAPALLAKLTLEHPTRSILLLLGKADEPSAQSAWVTAYCHRPNPAAPQICSEFISLECKGSAATHVASTLRSLMLGGLPSVIVWSSQADIHHPLLMELSYDGNRVITDAVQASERVSALNRLWNIRQLCGQHVVVSDVIWSALKPMRHAIARAFDTRNPALLTQVEFDSWSAESVIIAAWTAATLRWSLVDAHPKSGAVHLQFAQGRAMNFVDAQHTARAAHVQFQQSDQTRFSLEFVRANRTLVDLLGDELNIWSRDPVFDETFDLLQEWLARR